MKPRNNTDLRVIMAQHGITQTELAAAMDMWQPNLSVLLNKTPLSDAERQRILDGIERVKNNR